MGDWRKLSSYTQKQVIMNTYQNGELIGKDGYKFERILILEDKLIICGRENVLAEIETSRYSAFEQLFGFPHHYAFSNSDERLELYFV